MSLNKLKLIHFQLTRKCNLRCPFCGQWGESGFMKEHSDKELELNDWLEIISQLVIYRNDTGISPEVIVWGGEPLVYNDSSKIAESLRQNNFKTALVTNGILLKEFSSVINENIDTVYLSLDGPKEVHEEIRGRKNIYSKILNGIEALDLEKVALVGLLTLCEKNHSIVADFPFEMAKLGFHKMFIQNLIYCSPKQCEKFKDWMRMDFNLEPPNIDSWVVENFETWVKCLPETYKKIEENISRNKYPIEVICAPSEISSGNIQDWFVPDVKLKRDREPCLMPCNHLHINPDGSAHFCVDFNDFSLGKVTKGNLLELFSNENANKFRKAVEEGRHPLCERCPWYYNKKLKIDDK